MLMINELCRTIHIEVILIDLRYSINIEKTRLLGN